MQKEIDNKNEFKQRLEWMLAGRKVTPWAKEMGLTSGTMGRLSKGEVPGPEILTAIMRRENVSISWLVDGKGLPFIVDTHFTDDSLLTMLRMHAADAPYSVCFTLNADRGMAVFIFSQPASYYIKKGKPLEYRQIEVVIGPYTQKIRNALIHQRITASTTKAFLLDDLEFSSLIRGQYGTYQLFGDGGLTNPGLIGKAPPDTEFLDFFRNAASADADQTTKRKSSLPDT